MLQAKYLCSKLCCFRREVFLSLPYKPLQNENWRAGRAIYDPRDIMWTIWVQKLLVSLYVQCVSTKPCGIREEAFQSMTYLLPLQPEFLMKSNILNNSNKSSIKEHPRKVSINLIYSRDFPAYWLNIIFLFLLFSSIFNQSLSRYDWTIIPTQHSTLEYVHISFLI